MTRTPPRLTPASVEAIHEGDGGTVCWLHLPGHVPLDEAATLFWSWLANPDWNIYGVTPAIRRGGPEHRWFRKVPSRTEDGDAGSMGFYSRKGGRGATALTVASVGPLARPPHECLHWPQCHAPGVAGASPDNWTHGPRYAPPGPRILWGEPIWACRDHQGSLKVIGLAADCGLTRAETLDRFRAGRLDEADLGILVALHTGS